MGVLASDMCAEGIAAGYVALSPHSLGRGTLVFPGPVQPVLHHEEGQLDTWHCVVTPDRRPTDRFAQQKSSGASTCPTPACLFVALAGRSPGRQDPRAGCARCPAFPLGGPEGEAASS